jgi:hypothetical protein
MVSPRKNLQEEIFNFIFLLFSCTCLGVFCYQSGILAIGSDDLSITGDSREFAEGLDLCNLCQRLCILPNDKVGTIADTQEIIGRSIGREIYIGE